jgi:predicted Zn-dependent protease
VYTETGRVDAGLAEARKLQKERPDSAAGFALEGEIHSRKAKWPEAATAYRAAMTRQATPFVVGRLHAILVAGGKGDDAAALVQKWLKEHPDDVALRGNLAQRRKAVELSPNDGEIRLHLAQALLKSGDKGGARKEVEALLQSQATGPAQRAEAEKLRKDL